MEPTEYGWKLRSGRIFVTHSDIIGIDTDRHPTGGYDNNAYIQPVRGEEPPPFTAEERKEIAEFMILRWTLFSLHGPR
jgi:hypothetical protein